MTLREKALLDALEALGRLQLALEGGAAELEEAWDPRVVTQIERAMMAFAAAASDAIAQGRATIPDSIFPDDQPLHVTISKGDYR